MKLTLIDGKKNQNNMPTLSIGYGTIRLNKVLYKILGEPEYVKFAIDNDELIVGIAIAKEGERGACKVNPNQLTIGASYASKLIRILSGDIRNTCKLTCERFEDEWFIAHVKKGE